MTGSKAKNHRCVIGDDMTLPNELTYLQPLSGRKRGVWIGYCKGDKSHKEHIIIIKKSKKWFLLNTIKDVFKKPDGRILGTRMFDRMPQLKCPEGKIYMALQKVATDELKMDNVDLYKCKGNTKGKGHKPHLTRIHHGILEVDINKKSVGVLIITIESD